MMNFLEETNQWVSKVSSILIENPKALDHLLGDRTVRIHDTEKNPFICNRPSLFPLFRWGTPGCQGCLGYVAAGAPSV